jgi:hypothetical protein
MGCCESGNEHPGFKEFGGIFLGFLRNCWFFEDIRAQ